MSKAALTPEVLGFDPEQLTEKYKHERDRRVRDDAESQFVEVNKIRDEELATEIELARNMRELLPGKQRDIQRAFQRS